jgi:hypothetical protein
VRTDYFVHYSHADGVEIGLGSGAAATDADQETVKTLHKLAGSGQWGVIQDLLDERADILVHHSNAHDMVVRLGSGAASTEADRRAVVTCSDPKLKQVMAQILEIADRAQLQRREVTKHDREVRKLATSAKAIQDDIQERLGKIERIRRMNKRLMILVVGLLVTTGAFVVFMS